jgi:hypothetical protein
MGGFELIPLNPKLLLIDLREVDGIDKELDAELEEKRIVGIVIIPEPPEIFNKLF